MLIGFKKTKKMTAVTELLTHCKKMISEGHQIDTQGLVHWIEDKLLDLEKQQIIDAFNKGFITDQWDKSKENKAEQYYNEIFKNTKK